MGRRKEGSITVSVRVGKNGKQYKYYVFSWYDESGVQHTKSFSYTIAGKKEAKDFQDYVTAKKEQGVPVSNVPLLGAWITEYLAKVKKPVLKEASFNRYVDCAKKLKDFWERPLDQISPMDIQRLYERILQDGLSTSSIHSLHVLLRGAYQNAYCNGFIVKDIMLSVKAPAVVKKNETHIFTFLELRKIFWAYRKMVMGRGVTGKKFRSPHDYSLFFWMLLMTGMRLGEGLALEWKSIDFDNRVIDVHQSTAKDSVRVKKPKTDSGNRKVPIVSDALLGRLKKLKEKAPKGARFVFASRGSNGQRMLLEQNLHKVWHKVCREAGVEQPKGQAFHALRHTFASYNVRYNGDIIPLSSLSRILGHSKVGTTLNIYYHHLPDDNERILYELEKRRKKKK